MRSRQESLLLRGKTTTIATMQSLSGLHASHACTPALLDLTLVSLCTDHTT